MRKSEKRKIRKVKKSKGRNITKVPKAKAPRNLNCLSQHLQQKLHLKENSEK